jgi:hypothetical protein
MHASLARADAPAPPTPERVRSAAEEFDKGRRAFVANQFEDAAVFFENAFHDAPSVEAARLVVRARSSAGQWARAATWGAQALLDYPEDGTLRTAVEKAVREAKLRAHKLTLRCEEPCSVTVDGRLASLRPAAVFELYLDPGARTVVASVAANGGDPNATPRSQSMQIASIAGGEEVQSLTLAPKPPAAVTPHGTDLPGPAANARPAKKAPERRGDAPLPQAVFWVAAGVTVALGAATTVSGILTLEEPGKARVQRECAGLGETCPAYQEGLRAETRTNVLLVATGVVALGTLVLIPFTRWRTAEPSSQASSSLKLSPGVVGVRGVEPGVGVTGRF